MFFYLKKKNEEKRNVDHDRNEDHPYSDSFNNSYSDVYNDAFNETYDDSHQFNDSMVSDVGDTCDGSVNNESRYLRCFNYYQSQPAKVTINTTERRQWHRFGVFIVNFEHISHLVVVFLLLTLSR